MSTKIGGYGVLGIVFIYPITIKREKKQCCGGVGTKPKTPKTPQNPGLVTSEV
jgi:hypothetical protein